MSIFDAWRQSRADVVLPTEALTHLTARGQSHFQYRGCIGARDRGDVAVARVLRHLTDQLLDAAAKTLLL